MKLKTLKDIDNSCLNKKHKKICIIHIKAEAIKWVKEDREAYCRLHTDDMGTWKILLDRWMKRLNITEDDLQ